MAAVVYGCGQRMAEVLNFKPNLTTEQKEQIIAVCLKNEGVFPTKDNRLGHCYLVKHRIETSDARPIRQQFRPFSPAEKLSINESCRRKTENTNREEIASVFQIQTRSRDKQIHRGVARGGGHGKMSPPSGKR